MANVLPACAGALNGAGRGKARLDARNAVHGLFNLAAGVIDAANDNVFLGPAGDDQLAIGKKTPRSPVSNQPSARKTLLASGLRKYPGETAAPQTCRWPTVSSRTICWLSSTIRMLTPGIGGPKLVNLLAFAVSEPESDSRQWTTTGAVTE